MVISRVGLWGPAPTLQATLKRGFENLHSLSGVAPQIVSEDAGLTNY